MRISFVKWIYLYLKTIPNKLSTNYKNIVKSFEYPETWGTVTFFSAIFGVIPTVFIAIFFAPYGLLSFPLLVIWVFYSYYRYQDPQQYDSDVLGEKTR